MAQLEAERAKMEQLFKLESQKDEEKEFLKKKEQELQQLLDEQMELQKKQIELIEQQKQEIEYAKWQVQFEREYAVKQYQQMLEEHEKEK